MRGAIGKNAMSAVARENKGFNLIFPLEGNNFNLEEYDIVITRLRIVEERTVLGKSCRFENAYYGNVQVKIRIRMNLQDSYDLNARLSVKMQTASYYK